MYEDLAALANRLDRRVDKMVDVSLPHPPHLRRIFRIGVQEKGSLRLLLVAGSITCGMRSGSATSRTTQRGLIDEIKQLRQEAVRLYGSEETIDHQEGIFQSIGR